jgi:hypothetical protein
MIHPVVFRFLENYVFIKKCCFAFLISYSVLVFFKDIYDSYPLTKAGSE